jgi:hypothetical protein
MDSVSYDCSRGQILVCFQKRKSRVGISFVGAKPRIRTNLLMVGKLKGEIVLFLCSTFSICILRQRFSRAKEEFSHF